QRDARVDDPAGDDLYSVGTLAVVKQVIRLPNDTLQVLVEGRGRARIDEYLAGPSLRARVTTLSESTAEAASARTQALVEQVQSASGQSARQNKSLRPDTLHRETLRGMKEPRPLGELVAKYSTWDVADKQAGLEETDVGNRLELLYGFLTRDLERFESEK